MGASRIPLIGRAEKHRDRTAIIAQDGSFTYQNLLDLSGRVALNLLQDRTDLGEARVGFLTTRGFGYAAVQWGIWRGGGIAVPLCELYPPSELDYVIQDADCSIVVAHPEFESLLRAIAEPLGVRFLLTEELFQTAAGSLPEINPSRRGMIVYTSGTTGKPKGVVSTHLNIQAQITSLIEAWEWSAADYILHVLPLHHIHGIINVLSCALWAGAKCEILPRFDAREVWDTFIQRDLTLFMAVPTMYVKLMAAWETGSPSRQNLMLAGCGKLRLMVSGSAALPVSVLKKWESVTGHTILERYGMTEIGMALSNPLHGERMPGYVGTELPGVEVRLVDDAGNPVSPGIQGEIQVRGPNVFMEYWQQPEETEKAFSDGWFWTGDIAVVERGSYRILGRKGTDIINTGGYKVSALEIEEVLRSHPAVRECAVVGLEDPTWGERVCAALILRSGLELTLEELRSWGKTKLAPYKVPTRLVVLKDLPCNPLGKVTKPALRQLLEATPE